MVFDRTEGFFERARVGIEIVTGRVRGIRISGRKIAAATGRSLGEVAAKIALSPRDDVRVVLSSLDSSFARVLERPPRPETAPEELSLLPLPATEYSWNILPFGLSRCLLVTAPQFVVEHELEKAGIWDWIPQGVSAVGTEPAAIVAAAEDVPGGSPFIWAGEYNSWIVHRRRNPFGDVEISAFEPVAMEVPATVHSIVGPVAAARAEFARRAKAVCIAGLGPEYFTAWGATRWRTRRHPSWPDLQDPGKSAERLVARSAVARRHNLRRVAVAAFVLGLVIPLPGRFALRSAEATLASEEASARAVDDLLQAKFIEAHLVAPPERTLHRDLSAVLSAASKFGPGFRLAEISVGEISMPFGSLRLRRGEDDRSGTIRIAGGGEAFPRFVGLLQERFRAPRSVVVQPIADGETPGFKVEIR